MSADAGATRAAASARQLTAPGAIVHDWFQGYHGAERVADAMREVWRSDATPDVFTFSAALELLPRDLSAAIVQQSHFARMPGIRQRGHDPGRWRYLLPYMPHYFASLDLVRYDVVVSSSHACANNVRPREDATHVCYCYTPMRYAWMPETDGSRVGGIKGAAFRALTQRPRRIDREAASRIDGYVGISTAVQERIRRFYGVDAEVIHPPVEVHEFDPKREKKSGSFLWVHRLVSYKHPIVVAEAFRGLPYELTMVGVGPLEEELRADLPPNVTLRGWVTREELARLYAEASGFIHVGEEDFGITMVEALASGTPVIALNRGGSRDIVRDGKHGLLVDAASVEQVREAAERLARQQWEPKILTDRAAEFSHARFVDRMIDYINGVRSRA